MHNANATYGIGVTGKRNGVFVRFAKKMVESALITKVVIIFITTRTKANEVAARACDFVGNRNCDSSVDNIAKEGLQWLAHHRCPSQLLE